MQVPSGQNQFPFTRRATIRPSRSGASEDTRFPDSVSGSRDDPNRRPSSLHAVVFHPAVTAVFNRKQVVGVAMVHVSLGGGGFGWCGVGR